MFDIPVILLMKSHSVQRSSFISSAYRSNKMFKLILLAFLILFGGNQETFALVSLVVRDRIDTCEVNIKIAGQARTTKYTLIRDASGSDQFFYVPNEPRLSLRGDIPEFTLISYQFVKDDNSVEFIEGGILQFGMKLDAPDGTTPQFVQCIKDQFPSVQNPKVAALPLESSRVQVYTSGGDLLGASVQGNGVGQAFATQKKIFVIELSRFGVDVYKALVNSATGIPLSVELTYKGLTAPVGFRVTVDYEQAFKHYSRHSKFAAQASYFGLFGASVDIDSQTIRETLVREGVLDIDIITGEGCDMVCVDKHLQPILARINQQIVETLTPPAQVDPAQAAEPKAGGRFFSAGYSVALKDISQVKKIKETISFQVRQQVTRTTVADGFIGLGDYPEEVREKLVQKVTPGAWSRAIMVLPAVGDSIQEIGVTQLGLSVSLYDGELRLAKKQFTWKPGRPNADWHNALDKPQSVAAFALDRGDMDEDRVRRLHFQLDWLMTSRDGRDELPWKEKTSVLNTVGSFEETISAPLVDVDFVSISAFNLPWIPPTPLRFVGLQLKSGDRVFRHTFLQRIQNGQVIPPDLIYWPVHKPRDTQPKPVTAKVIFNFSGNRTRAWPYNGKDLFEEFGALVVVLDKCSYSKPRGDGNECYEPIELTSFRDIEDLNLRHFPGPLLPTK